MRNTSGHFNSPENILDSNNMEINSLNNGETAGQIIDIDTTRLNHQEINAPINTKSRMRESLNSFYKVKDENIFDAMLAHPDEHNQILRMSQNEPSLGSNS